MTYKDLIEICKKTTFQFTRRQNTLDVLQAFSEELLSRLAAVPGFEDRHVVLDALVNMNSELAEDSAWGNGDTESTT